MTTCEYVDDELGAGLLTELARVRARAEARETEAMIRYRDLELARIAGLERPLQRQIEKAAIPLDIGQAMGLSEGQVWGRLATADRVREHTPRVWLAFRDGSLDFARVWEISSTGEVLQREESYIRLDQRVVAYSASTPWLSFGVPGSAQGRPAGLVAHQQRSRRDVGRRTDCREALG